MFIFLIKIKCFSALLIIFNVFIFYNNFIAQQHYNYKQFIIDNRHM